jgi:hypothetical protein
VSAAGVLKLYNVVLATVGGNISSVTSATDPNGNSLIGASGWAFTVTSSTSFQITHPLGNVWIGAFSSGVNGANVLTKSFFGNTTGTYSMYQDSAYTIITFNTLTPTQAGYAASGVSTLTINYFSKV